MNLDPSKGNVDFRIFTCHHCGHESKPVTSGKNNPVHGYELRCPDCGKFLGWSGLTSNIKDSAGKRLESSIWSAKRLKVTTCQYCRRDADCLGDRERLEVHHVVPIEDGGTDTLDNIWIVCTCCHKEIHHRRVYFNSHMSKFFKAYAAYQQRMDKGA